MEAGTDLRDLGSGDSGAVGVARVTGVAAFHTTPTVPPALVDVPLDGVTGTYVEVLNWAAVRRVVHPRPQKGPETPSPFPYLPSTPQEVLLAYLEVVGLRPSDRYGAEVTVDEMSADAPVTSTSSESLGMDDLRLGGYEDSVCVDGKSRRACSADHCRRELPGQAGVRRGSQSLARVSGRRVVRADAPQDRRTPSDRRRVRGRNRRLRTACRLSDRWCVGQSDVAVFATRSLPREPALLPTSGEVTRCVPSWTSK